MQCDKFINMFRIDQCRSFIRFTSSSLELFVECLDLNGTVKHFFFFIYSDAYVNQRGMNDEFMCRVVDEIWTKKLQKFNQINKTTKAMESVQPKGLHTRDDMK